MDTVVGRGRIRTPEDGKRAFSVGIHFGKLQGLSGGQRGPLEKLEKCPLVGGRCSPGIHGRENGEQGLFSPVVLTGDLELPGGGPVWRAV